MDEIISVKNLEKSFKQGKSEVKALNNVNFEIQKGEITCIFGPSGAGKSTLLHIIGLMDIQTGGILKLFNIDTKKLSPAERAKIRNEKIGFLFQFHYLMPDFKVYENIKMPMKIKGVDNKEKFNEIVDFIGIRDILDRYPMEISGGQAQRVALARAIINEPQILLADEPIGNLDLENSKIIWDLLLKLVKSNNTTLVYVTHNLENLNYADKVIFLKHGSITEIRYNR